MQLNEKLNLQQVQTIGILRDVQNRKVELEFESTRENFDSRARKCISDAATLINLAKAGENYKKNRLYEKIKPNYHSSLSRFCVCRM